MITIRNILCPVDRSDISLRALTIATGLAKWYDARLRVIEVIGLPEPSFGPAPMAVYGLTQDVRRGVADELERFTDPAREAGVDVRVSVEEGDVVNGILAEADAVTADLVVLGTHGRRGVERLTLGSVAEKVLRRARCPVLTVPPAPRVLPPGEALFKRILCAVDFSDASLKGLEFALSLAKEADARIAIVHVIDWPADRTIPTELAETVSGIRTDWEARLRQQLHALVPLSACDWCTPEELLVVGRPADEILRLAREREEEAIVLGVHGRGAIDLALFGSTTHRVVREAPCPVFTIRSRQ